ncbi:PLP-dependent aminotransferase family protein [[Micrococcus luteus] ATCC 49442]|uniref:aminotransferase-like domain-containing protein n=1 Tax=[Micrococcus luteus] ATCC 49442 TaxID=2698727 RepID=UPI001FCB9C5B|nr:PLP-dependent aminotransferase family protein [[Micrococcus luteus] ATCC 49442]
MLKLAADPQIISFGGGFPDPDSFPAEAFAEILREQMASHAKVALQYSAAEGLPSLRSHIARFMGSDGVHCSADDILVLQGAQQGLDLVAKALVDPGDVIVTENPTFIGALVAFAPYEPRYAVVGLDEDGMDTDDLERQLREHPGTKFIYTVPDFQNPTGVTMSLERRRRVLELAEIHDVLILEDTPYRTLRYEGTSIPSLKSLDTTGRVIYLGSFSKMLAPGLRLGWVVAAPEILRKLALLKLAADTQCSTLNMSVVSAFLDSYDLQAHTRRSMQIHKTQRDLALETIKSTFPASIEHTSPDGGLFIWLTFPTGFDAGQHLAEVAIPDARAAYVPGSPFYALSPETNHARLSYAGKTPEDLIQGLTRLGESFQQSSLGVSALTRH